ncbi:hypothetical protein H4582DRAFT_2075500 [Lactarius indigo]|nr:hypothetical protein H4582DRAFT_2075500 [Lactarius indigo]
MLREETSFELDAGGLSDGKFALESLSEEGSIQCPAFDAELLAAGPGTLTHLTQLRDTLPYAFFDEFLAALMPLDVPATAAPRLVVLDSSPDLVVALTPGHPLRCATLRITSTLYDGLRPAALFGTLGGALKDPVLVLVPDVDMRTCGRLLGAPGNTGAALEPLERSLDGTR